MRLTLGEVNFAKNAEISIWSCSRRVGTITTVFTRGLLLHKHNVTTVGEVPFNFCELIVFMLT